MAYFSKKFQKLLDLYCRNTLSSFAKISRQELSKIDSEYQTDSSLRSTVQDLSSALRDKGLEFSSDPIDIETDYQLENVDGEKVEKCYMTLRLPRNLKKLNIKGNQDLYNIYLELRDSIWEILHSYCVKKEEIPGLKIYRLNDINDHDEDDIHGYYYKFVLSFKPIKDLFFIKNFLLGLI